MACKLLCVLVLLGKRKGMLQKAYVEQCQLKCTEKIAMLCSSAAMSMDRNVWCFSWSPLHVKKAQIILMILLAIVWTWKFFFFPKLQSWKLKTSKVPSFSLMRMPVPWQACTRCFHLQSKNRVPYVFVDEYKQSVRKFIDLLFTDLLIWTGVGKRIIIMNCVCIMHWLLEPRWK